MVVLNYHDAVAVIESQREQGYFAGPRPEQLILAAEAALGLKFPPIYRQFIGQYGAGSFGGAEIYGVTNANFENVSVPNGVWVTLRNRIHSQLPANLIIIGDTGDGNYYCLETANLTMEAPVIVYQPSAPLEAQRREEVAEDFGRFLFDKVTAEL